MNIKDLSCFDHIFEPIVVIDDKKHIIYFNYFFSSFSRYSPRVLNKIEDFPKLFTCPSVDLPSFFKKAIKKNDATTSEEIKISFENPMASYDVVIKIIPINLDEKKYFLVCFRDLSIEKNLHEKYRKQLELLKKNHSQIVQADKISSMNELIAGITSDLNNPMAVASGNSELIDMHLSKDDLNKTKNSLIKCNKELQHSLEKINKIILNMKNFLSDEREKKEYCNLKDVVDNAVHSMSDAYRKAGITIKKEIKDKNTISFMLRIKIEEILTNLLSNALHAMAKSNQKGLVKIALYQKDCEYAVIDVDDNGPGIPTQAREEIFKSFFSNNKDEGSGLGLAISSKIIEAHHGSLTLEQKKGKGALFRICLPIVEIGNFLQHQNLQNSLDSSKETKGRKVLLIDSEVKILNILSKFLEDDGHASIGSVVTVNAFKILNSIEVDLIIVDFNSIQMKSHEFIEKVRKINMHTPIIYMASKENLGQCKKDKDKNLIFDFVVKPFNKNDILKKVKIALKI